MLRSASDVNFKVKNVSSSSSSANNNASINNNINCLTSAKFNSRRATSLRISKRWKEKNILEESLNGEVIRVGQKNNTAKKANNGMLKRVRSVLIKQGNNTSNHGMLYRSASAKSFRDENGLSPSRTMSKREKYFSKQDKNIFMKFIHPSYQERNQQFKKLFQDKGHVESADIFLVSYSCAYQREILAQGRMFISQLNVCFYANIFGWETILVIPHCEINTITKQKAAKIFPNSIQIEKKNGEKLFFASFVNRDKSLNILRIVWERRVDESVSDQSNLTKISPEEVWELLNNNNNNNNQQNQQQQNQQTNSSNSNSSLDEKMILSNQASSSATAKSSPKDKDNSSESSLGSVDQSIDDDIRMMGEDNFVYEENENDAGTSNNDPIKCPCTEHPGRLIMDAVFPISLTRIHSLLLTDNQFIDKLNNELKNKGYAASPWVRDKDGNETRNCTYSVALNHAMAPKNVIVNEKQILYYYPKRDEGFVVFKETQNSGVPYSDNFVVRCTYCISRIGRNEVRFKVHGGIHYRKSVWSIIKGYIEKGTSQGLDDHYQLLEKLLTEECEFINSNSSENSDTSTHFEIRNRKQMEPIMEKAGLRECVRMDDVSSPSTPLLMSSSSKTKLSENSSNIWASKKNLEINKIKQNNCSLDNIENVRLDTESRKLQLSDGMNLLYLIILLLSMILIVNIYMASNLICMNSSKRSTEEIQILSKFFDKLADRFLEKL